MFHLLPSESYSSVRGLFAGIPQALIIHALLDGTSPGCVWVDDLDHPTSAFMQSAEGHLLVGNSHNEGFNNGLKAYLLTFNAPYIVIEPDHEAWQPIIAGLVDGRAVLRPRLYYQFTQPLQPLVDGRSLPADMAMLPVDAAFLARTSLKNMPEVIDWIETNWHSQADFLTNGFGCCLVKEETIVSWSLADCISGTRCEIGIFTDAAYRKLGFASLTVSAMVEAAATLGLTAIGWHCWEDNFGSRGVAEKVGFKQMHPYPAYVCQLNPTL